MRAPKDNEHQNKVTTEDSLRRYQTGKPITRSRTKPRLLASLACTEQGGATCLYSHCVAEKKTLSTSNEQNLSNLAAHDGALLQWECAVRAESRS
jgi:hypothetical protein